MMRVKDIRQMFIDKYLQKNFTKDGMLELRGTSFIADEPTIFGKPNEEYAHAEIQWYISQSKSVHDIKKYYKLIPKIWLDVSDKNGMINSNYGWCVFSLENGDQFNNVVKELKRNPSTRRASMIYTHPDMHQRAIDNGRSDFICTWGVDYHLRDNKLSCVVKMRSNHARQFGYANDLHWQKFVLGLLCQELDVEMGDIVWQASSLHLYPSDFKLLEEYINGSN